jgi:hypothetical protein
MTGQKIREHLSAHDYDHFHELYHALTEVALSKINSLHGYCKIIEILSLQNPEVFSDSDAAMRLNEFTVLAGQFETAMRKFYWPQPIGDLRQTTAFSMKRWEPYDEAAWETMFAQMVVILQPFVWSAMEYCKAVSSGLSGEAPHVENIRQILSQMELRLADLSRLCHAEELESFLFHPPRP